MRFDINASCNTRKPYLKELMESITLCCNEWKIKKSTAIKTGLFITAVTTLASCKEKVDCTYENGKLTEAETAVTNAQTELNSATAAAFSADIATTSLQASHLVSQLGQ